MTHKEAIKRGKFYFKMRKFRKTKEPIDINGVNIDNVMKNIDKKMKKMKHFDGYGKYSNKNMKSLLINFPKSNGSIESFVKLKHMPFIVNEKHENTLNFFRKIWDRFKES